MRYERIDIGLYRSVATGVYFARSKVNGKIFTKSLQTKHQDIAKVKLHHALRGFKMRGQKHCPTGNCYVYVIKLGEHYKIGWTTNLGKRLHDLEGYSPYKLERIHVYATPSATTLERLLHADFHKKRIKGEWFALTPEDIEIIKTKQKYKLLDGYVYDEEIEAKKAAAKLSFSIKSERVISTPISESPEFHIKDDLSVITT